MATPTQTSGEDNFIKNLGKIYGLYTGGFLAFVVLLAILEQIGVPNKILGYLFVFFTIAIYASHRRALPHRAGLRILCRRPESASLL